MTDTKRLLQSIGQRTFIRCHPVAVSRGEDFDTDDLLKCDPELHGTSRDAQRTRVSKLKRLVREGLVGEALDHCRQGRRR